MIYFNCVFILAASFCCNGANAEADADPSMSITQIVLHHRPRVGKELHEQCTTTDECKTLHAECIDKTCVCSSQYREVDGQCIERIALNLPCVSCHEDPGCAGEHAECFDGFCKCKQGYTDQGGVCVADTPSEGEIMGPCLVSGNCTADDSECNGGTCECLTRYVSVGPDCFPAKNHEEMCAYSPQCPVGMFCNCDNVCSCKEGYVYTSEFTCEKISLTGETCSASEQCSGTHTECINNQCACDPLYGPSIEVPNNCVSKTTSSLLGPILLNNETLPYKEEYSVLNSTTYLEEAEPVLNDLIESIIDFLIDDGLDVKEIVVFSVDNGTAGGSSITLLATLYNPDYNRETVRAKISSTAESISNEQLLKRTQSALQALDSVDTTNTPDAKPVSQIGELCDDSSHCDIVDSICVDKACVCPNEFDEDSGTCV